jgi:acetyltransferase-like isoleucine patch superfamily enzyme
MEAIIGKNSVIGENVSLGENVVIKANCVIEDNVAIGANTLIDSNTIIRNDVTIGDNSVIGANCIIGEYQMDFIHDRHYHRHDLTIGDNAIIRSGSIIYSGSNIGNNFQTGHHATIREQAEIGNNVSVGTLSDVQGHCKLGNYVRLHSNVFVPMLSQIDDCVWIFPCVVITNDPTPPSNNEVGCHIHSFAIISANATILPGLDVAHDAVIGAGAVVTKDVKEYQLVVGNPGKVIGDVRNVKNHTTGEIQYPWRYHFDRAMPWEGRGYDEWYNSIEEVLNEI